MNKAHENLEPSTVIKIALGKQLLQYAKIALKIPLSLSSYLELGQLFCDVFNGKRIATITENTLSNLAGCCSDFISTDAQQMSTVLQMILAEEDPGISQIPTDELITNPLYLDKISILSTKIHQHGLAAVVTPAIRKKLVTAGIHFMSVKASNHWPIIEEEAFEGQVDQILYQDFSDLEKYLKNALAAFFISRERVTLKIDVVANYLLAGVLLSKAVNEAGYKAQIESFDASKNTHVPIEAIERFFGKVKPLAGPFISDFCFLNDYIIENDLDHQPQRDRDFSMIYLELTTFRDSPKANQDLLRLVKCIMPFLSMMKDFLNQTHQKDKSILQERQQLLEAAQTALNENNVKSALEKFRHLVSQLKHTKSEDIPNQLLLGKAMMGLADCLKLRGEHQPALVNYFSAQAIFGPLLDEGDAKTYYQKCDKKCNY